MSMVMLVWGEARMGLASLQCCVQSLPASGLIGPSAGTRGESVRGGRVSLLWS